MRIRECRVTLNENMLDSGFSVRVWERAEVLRVRHSIQKGKGLSASFLHITLFEPENTPSTFLQFAWIKSGESNLVLGKDSYLFSIDDYHLFVIGEEGSPAYEEYMRLKESGDVHRG